MVFSYTRFSPKWAITINFFFCSVFLYFLFTLTSFVLIKKFPSKQATNTKSDTKNPSFLFGNFFLYFLLFTFRHAFLYNVFLYFVFHQTIVQIYLGKPKTPTTKKQFFIYSFHFILYFFLTKFFFTKMYSFNQFCT